MTILVVGYGSMGRRRIRMMRKIEPDCHICCVDTNEDRRRKAEADGFMAFSDLEYALQEVKPEIAFVCTSPGNHAPLILSIIEAGIHVFTELNLTDTDYDKIITASKGKGVTVFMSSTFLYNRVIQKISELVEGAQKPLTYIYHVGQYLPDWHPWENYRSFFAGKKETNGVREIFAIQLPWLIKAFGTAKCVSALGTRCTQLDIDYRDAVTVSFIHENGNIGTFTADVVSRNATTRLEVIGEDLHLLWGGHPYDLYVYDIENKEMMQIKLYNNTEHEEGYADTIIEDQYEDEVRAFLDVLNKRTDPKYTLEMDQVTLWMIDDIDKICEEHL